MINKLYSILVSGAFKIPEDWCYYRRYTELSVNYSGVPTYKDPYKRSLWANYIIELAKLCPLYSHILEMDPSNTYKNKCTAGHPSIDAVGCTITHLNTHTPVIVISADVSDNILSGIYNDLPFAVEIKDNIAEIHGTTVELDDGSNSIDINVCNPYAVPESIDINEIIALCRNLPSHIMDNMDLGKPQDAACALCIYLLSVN